MATKPPPKVKVNPSTGATFNNAAKVVAARRAAPKQSAEQRAGVSVTPASRQMGRKNPYTGGADYSRLFYDTSTKSKPANKAARDTPAQRRAAAAETQVRADQNKAQVNAGNKPAPKRPAKGNY